MWSDRSVSPEPDALVGSRIDQPSMNAGQSHVRVVSTQEGTLIKFTTDSPLDGVVNSSHLTNGECSQENTMEPITATVVIVALVALAC